MKKIITFLSLVCLFASCCTSCYTDKDKERLQDECRELQNQKKELTRQVEILKEVSYNMGVNAHKAGAGFVDRQNKYTQNKYMYIVKFKIKQGTFTLDIFEHVKNEMNSIEIEIPVCREYYEKLSIGQDITDSFKWGSLVMNGDFSALHMKVVGKRIDCIR